MTSSAAPHAPRVSVAVPVYNGRGWIGRTIETVLEQTFEDFEVVILDNASTDDTVEVVRGYADPRIRLYVNAENLGFVRNQNRAIAYGRGDLVKFLHADDALLPHCLERMVELFDRAPGLGLVFSRRRIELADESDPNLQRWRATYADLTSHFSGLDEVNDGHRLFAEWLDGEFFGNWIGEPSSVMMRRDCLARTGLFSPYVQIVNDIDLWLRALLCCGVGFIDEELTVYRASGINLTSGLKGRQRDWLDPLWMLEALAAETDALETFPRLRPLLARTRRRSLSGLARVASAHPSLTPEKLHDISRYLAYRMQAARGVAPRLHPALDEVASTGPAPRLVSLQPASATAS